MDIIDNSNNSSEQLNGFDLHLNRHGKGKLPMNLMKRLWELHRKNYNRNWQKSGQWAVSDSSSILRF